ncbi:MAG: SURF1 family protein [Chloroflexota bacterium]|nr:SURF1 family protein [Chloroflexota bacterium]
MDARSRGEWRDRLRYAVRQVFSRRWWWVTLYVVAICAGLASLGGWQLDRLAGRRARSADLAAQLTAPPVVLTAGTLGAGGADASRLPPELAYRRVVARGTFDYAQELALVNQVWDGRLGFHLITPLVLEGSDRAVLVDRGWVPAPPVPTPPVATTWEEYRPPGAGGPVEVLAWARPVHGTAPSRGARAQTGRLISGLDPVQLQARVTHPLLPLVVVQVPDTKATGGEAGEARRALPYRRSPNPDLGEGVHLIAAVQWFAFSLIGGAGYVIYLARQMPPPRSAWGPYHSGAERRAGSGRGERVWW